jgi:hypothetical protein
MHADLTKQVMQIDGKTPVEDGGKPLTLGAAAANALLAPEKGISGDKQVERFLLATRIYGEALPVELKAEEVALIKARVAEIYGPLVTGQMWQTIDPKSEAKPAA